MSPQCYTPVAILCLLAFTCTLLLYLSGEFRLATGLQQQVSYQKYKRFLGTKATYADRLRFNATSSGTCKESAFEQSCDNVTFIYHLVRHGTRHPTKKSLQRMRDIEDEEIQKKVAELFGEHSQLTDSGQEELYMMGIRMRQRYPHLFTHDYHPERYDFSSTHVPRALQSGDAYVYGLFEGRGTLGSSKAKAVAIRSEHESMLRFHKYCARYKSDVKKNEDVQERGEFPKLLLQHVPPLAQSLLKHSKADLGFLKPLISEKKHLRTLTRRVNSLWDICKFEIAVHGTSHTCDWLGFNEAQMHVLNYIEDAEVFWFKSYGFDINNEMTCALAKDIMGMVSSPRNFSVAARFAHAETLIPLAAKLGIFHEEEMREIFSAQADIDSEKVTGREWKSGRVSPFAGNLLFEVHSCKGEKFVKLVLNEQPIRSGKEKKWMLSLAELGNLLGAHDCDFEEICKIA